MKDIDSLAERLGMSRNQLRFPGIAYQLDSRTPQVLILGLDHPANSGRWVALLRRWQ
jgi:hypothetical protein